MAPHALLPTIHNSPVTISFQTSFEFIEASRFNLTDSGFSRAGLRHTEALRYFKIQRPHTIKEKIHIFIFDVMYSI